MLWYKGWLETRFRLLFSLGFFGILVIQSHMMAGMRPPDGVKADPVRVFVLTETVLVAMLCGMVGGAGIATQPSFQASKGLHGSTLFTLSLPVSRLRLLAVRAGIGWIEAAGGIAAMCCAMWILFPALRGTNTPEEVFKYTVTLIACASGLYAISVLLATFLDEQWRAWGNIALFWALWWLSSHTSLPASANVFRAMSDGSPLFIHTMPWLAMAFSLELAAILFFAALKVVQMREY
jgi:ABC-2 type transport system permease protein